MKAPSRFGSHALFNTLTFTWSALVGATLIYVYFPGRGENDIVFQAKQALGIVPFNDWHAPIMSALWQLLYHLTGTLGSLLVLQVAVFVLSSWTLSIAVLARTGSRIAAILPLLAILTPWALSQTGILWKDTQMAVAYMLGFGLLMLIQPTRPRTLWLLMPAVIVLVYGTCVRKNAVAALVPIAVYIGWLLVRAWREHRAETSHEPSETQAQQAQEAQAASIGPLKSDGRAWRLSDLRHRARLPLQVAAASVAVLAVLGGATLTTDAAVNRLWQVQHTGQSTQVKLDDVLFSIPPHELAGAPVPQEFKAHAQRARAVCLAMHEPWDAYWNCWGRGAHGKAYAALPASDTHTIDALWRDHVLTHPARYLRYRAHVYWYYLTSSRLVYWESHWQTAGDTVGLRSDRPHADALISQFVNFTNTGAGRITFLPIFWLVLGVVLLVCARWAGRLRAEVTVLSASAVVYILAYFPVVPANHFRYTYWSVLAVLMALALMIAGRFASRCATTDSVHQREGALNRI